MGRNTVSERDEGVGIEDLVLNDIGGILSEDEHEEEGGGKKAGGANVRRRSVVDPRYPV